MVGHEPLRRKADDRARPFRLSREEAQQVPADSDQDDPVSP
jgi:hypothetical protein